MDRFEKQELLEEFLVRWSGGRSLSGIIKDLTSEGRNRSDVELCSRIFEKWLSSKKQRSWSEIKKMRA
ncbi:MAG: hypothetical protein QW548_01755 [Candidatus Aenigmatarchaeota archaeon]